MNVKKFFLYGLTILCFYPSLAFSYSEEADEYILDLKGYSPETIELVQTVLNRNEGRYPAPSPSKTQQAWYNLVNNELVEPLEPAGYTKIYPGMLPKRPR